MSQGNLPLRVAVNISAMTVFQIVVVPMLMCFCSGCFKHLLLVALKSNSQALSLESSLLSQRFCISSSCQDFAAVHVLILKGRFILGLLERGLNCH